MRAFTGRYIADWFCRLVFTECRSILRQIWSQIRPTKLPFLETYDLPGAVAFVSSAIAYEPLENPLHPPEHLLSPQSVLSFQAGDSFDMATLLVCPKS